MWQGKALGALIGVVAAGPVGALFGTFIGHLFVVQAEEVRDTAVAGQGEYAQPGPLQIQEAFFRATFQVMGHLAKADGRVSEGEIRAARAMMSELRLGEREVQLAIDLFTRGKQPDFPLEANLRGLRALCRNRPDLCRMFVQIQLQAARWGDSLNGAGRQVLARVCAAIGVPAYEVVQMEALLRMERAARQPRDAQPTVDRIAAACEVLGIAHAASDNEVRRAYRRLMSQNHPDKLLAKGLPESCAQDRPYPLTGKATLPHRLLADEEPSFLKSLARRDRAGHGSAIDALNGEGTNSSRMGTSAIEHVVRRTESAETGLLNTPSRIGCRQSPASCGPS